MYHIEAWLAWQAGALVAALGDPLTWPVLIFCWFMATRETAWVWPKMLAGICLIAFVAGMTAVGYATSMGVRPINVYIWHLWTKAVLGLAVYGAVRVVRKRTADVL